LCIGKEKPEAEMKEKSCSDYHNKRKEKEEEEEKSLKS